MTPSRAGGVRRTRTIPELLVQPWFYFVFAVMAGAFVAQIVLGSLPARYVKLLMGGIFFIFLLKLPLHGVISVFLIILPFPTFIFLGNTNVIFVVFMLIVWGIKVRLGKEPIPLKTYIDYAAWCYIGIHILSLINVDTAANIKNGIFQIEFLAAAVGLYFLISKVLRTEHHLRVVLYALTITSLLVSITGVLEYFLPTVRLIPDWFIAAGPSGKRFALGGRVGGVFRFHGLLADFCAMLFILQVFLFVRTRNKLARIYLALLMAAGLFQIFITANRGGFIIWGIGVVYMLWLGRAALTARRLIIGLPMILLAALVVDALTAQYGQYVTLWMRLIGTQLERGMPDTRVVVWTEVLREIPNHLWLGHGPFYDLQGGIHAGGRGWPHSAYLMYLWTTGILGLLIFMWILIKLVIRSFPGGKLNLGSIPFAQGVLVVAHVQIIQFALGQIRDEHQRGNVYPYLMWMFFGLAVAAERIWKQGERPDQSRRRLEDPPDGIGTPDDFPNEFERKTGTL